MSKTKDVQEQVEEILQEQIALLRRRAKECARQFNHQVYDDLTAQYIVLEKKLKTLVAPSADAPAERVATMPAILGAPYDLKNAVSTEDPYVRGGLWAYAESQSPSVDSEVSRLPETTDNSGPRDSAPRSGLNWTRVRQHNS